jgi:COMPASS component BRE2
MTEEPRDEVIKKRRVRAIGERYREQIAEDIVWDIIDEVDFYAQDGGPSYVPEKEKEGIAGGAATPLLARGMKGES